MFSVPLPWSLLINPDVLSPDNVPLLYDLLIVISLVYPTKPTLFLPITLDLLITLFNYIGLIGLKIVTVFSYITPFIAMFVGSLLLGKTSNNKGWLEGIKYGLICVVIFFIFNYLAFDSGFNISNIILYIITLVSSVFGGMIGINLKKDND